MVIYYFPCRRLNMTTNRTRSLFLDIFLNFKLKGVVLCCLRLSFRNKCMKYAKLLSKTIKQDNFKLEMSI